MQMNIWICLHYITAENNNTIKLFLANASILPSFVIIMETQITFISQKDIPKEHYSLSSLWRPFQKAREYARSLNLKSTQEWTAFSKGKIPGLTKPEDIPFALGQFYKYHGWMGFNDWLSCGIVEVHIQ